MRRGAALLLMTATALALAIGASASSTDDGAPPSVADLLPPNPFEAPSAAGERFVAERAGRVEAPSEASRRASASVRRPAAAGGPLSADVLVNNPAGDTPEATTQSETALAVLDTTVCAGFNDSSGGGFSGLARSTNLGATFTDAGGIGGRGDPVIAVDEGTGTFFYGEIATIAGGAAIGVARSTDDCVTFGAPVNASPNTSGLAATTLSDKPWVAVDNTGGANDGNVYVCWTRFIDTSSPLDGTADTSELRVSRSTDGGATYVNEQVISAQGTAPFGCSVGVSPNGQVNVAWADRAGANNNDIRFSSSTNAGVTYTAPISISTGNRHPGVDTQVTCGGGTRPTLTGNIRMLHQAWLAVDASGGPFNGNLYVVWASDPAGTPDNSDVFFSRSTNNGGAWSAAAQLGGGGGATDQFEPFVSVAGAGAVAVAWYDRRNDAANNTNMALVRAVSTDGGANFGALGQVSDVAFGVPPINPNFDPGVAQCYMGEYIAVAGDDRNFFYSWGDNRTTIFTAAFPAPNGRVDPDVRFDAELAPVVNNADLGIVKTDAPDPVIAGTTLTYTLMVRNDGPHIALDVTVTDQLPAGVTHVSNDAGCDTSALPTMTCELGDMASGASRTITIQVLVSPSLVHDAGAPTTLTNTASVTGVANDPNAANNSDTETTSVVAVADLGIASFSAVNAPTELLVGQTATVTLRKVVTNAGPSSPMDAKLTLTASASPGASVTPAMSILTVPALAVGSPRTVEETVTIRCLEASQHSFTFTNAIAPLRAGDTDPNAANNTAQTSFSVICVVPVRINVKPGSFPNSVNVNEHSIAVAILTTAAGEYGLPLAFDATTIDPLSIRFGPRALVEGGGGATEVHGRGHLEDSRELDERTRDGDTDLVLHFDASDAGIVDGVTEVCVKGTWVDGGGASHLLFGCDSVVVRP